LISLYSCRHRIQIAFFRGTKSSYRGYRSD
jgi:hypothetical protein